MYAILSVCQFKSYTMHDLPVAERNVSPVQCVTRLTCHVSNMSPFQRVTRPTITRPTSTEPQLTLMTKRLTRPIDATGMVESGARPMHRVICTVDRCLCIAG